MIDIIKNMIKTTSKIILFSLLIAIAFSLFVPVNSVQAQEKYEELPSPGITPDSFWYFGEILKERMTLIFTLDKASKLNKYFEHADERLAEAAEMDDRNRSRETITALSEFISLAQRAEVALNTISEEELEEHKIELYQKISNQIFYLNLMLKENTDKIVKPKIKEAKQWAENVKKLLN